MLNHCVILFCFRKGKTDHFSYKLRAIYIFFLNYFSQYKGQKHAPAELEDDAKQKCLKVSS